MAATVEATVEDRQADSAGVAADLREDLVTAVDPGIAAVPEIVAATADAAVSEDEADLPAAGAGDLIPARCCSDSTATETE